MMLARVAESMYWMGRYVERAECTARIIVEHSNLHVDLPRGYEVGWEPLLQVTGTRGLFFSEGRRATADEDLDPGEEQVLRFLVADSRNPGSIVLSLSQARENLRTTRSLLPRETWEILNELYLFAAASADDAIDRRTRFRYLRRVIQDAQALRGMLTATMSHDEAYSFLMMGGLLERADMTTRVLDVRAGSLAPEVKGGYRPFDNVQWMGALRSVGAYQMYRRSVGPKVRASSAVRFLLQDPHFPRSVTHCLDHASRFLKTLPHPEAALDATAEALLVVHEAPLPNAATRAGAAAGEFLAQVVDNIQVALGRVHDEIEGSYFSAPATLPMSA